ncbi:MAG: class I SAM-dependent methyltransferase [Oscillospiraceae bacterium]|nr:class I SAM-dependent methyltransferase [Oscillospiraceae bacterium]
MREANGWKDYELIDTSSGERLEKWGNYVLVRPDPQVIWETQKNNILWNRADAVYHRSVSGGGSWEYKNNLPNEWIISWKDLSFYVTPTSFKHTGVFPEQAANWELYMKLIDQAKRPINVLNLFGYTGIATLACLKAGANVCHVDASKGMVTQAKKNAVLSKLDDKNVRWIVDDCKKFVQREYRRGKQYDAIIMDPPSYGRGPSGEIWKLENDLFDFVRECVKILSPDPLFVSINTYTTGVSSSAIGYLLKCLLPEYSSHIHSDEIGLIVSSNGYALPCGNTTLLINER